MDFCINCLVEFRVKLVVALQMFTNHKIINTDIKT